VNKLLFYEVMMRSALY